MPGTLYLIPCPIAEEGDVYPKSDNYNPLPYYLEPPTVR